MATPRGTKYAARLRNLRTDARVTQKQLAQMIGCQQPHISGMESGRRRISPERWARIETALKGVIAQRKASA